MQTPANKLVQTVWTRPCTRVFMVRDAPAQQGQGHSLFRWNRGAQDITPATRRFRLPAKPQRYGWEQRSLIGTESADLRDGDVYYDTNQVAVLMVMNEDQMFCVHQPERVTTSNASVNWDPGDPKNVVITSGGFGTRIVTLNDDSTVVPDGTTVRVYRNSDASNPVTVRFGTSGTQHTLTQSKMGEYVFMGAAWRSTQHDVPFIV